MSLIEQRMTFQEVNDLLVDLLQNGLRVNKWFAAIDASDGSGITRSIEGCRINIAKSVGSNLYLVKLGM